MKLLKSVIGTALIGIISMCFVSTLFVRLKGVGRSWARQKNPTFRKMFVAFRVRGRGKRYIQHEVYQ